MKSKLLVILFFAALFRFIGVNWDTNWHLHPDERFLTMVATGLTWPTSIAQYLDTNTSPLNPHNVGFGFYVYGTWPVLLVKAIADIMSRGDYIGITLVGRVVSGLLDLGTLLLVFLITKKLTNKVGASLLASALYALSVLPIQLSHFFAVDTFLVFFLTLSFYILIKIIKDSPSLLLCVLLGLTFGLSISSKVNAIFFIPIIALGLLFSLINTRKIIPLLIYGLVFSVTLFLTVRLSQPYLFANSSLFSITLNPKVIANWTQLKSFDNPDNWFPPAVLWINSKKLIFPLENLLLWGLGLPFGLLTLISIPYALFRYRHHLLTLVSVWIIGLFIYQGLQFAKPMRYFYPIYPFLAITTGVFIFDFIEKIKNRHLILLILFILLSIWPISFTSIYTRPHSRITSSKWIEKNLPAGSRISCEVWDDCLPLGGSPLFTIVEYPLYDPDSPDKWEKVSAKLYATDYIILTSNRLYGSLLTVPERYPTTNLFYRYLFDGSLGFKKIAEISSRPNLPILNTSVCITPPNIFYGSIARPTQECPLTGISFVDDYADESFTVYDHPKILIFKKTNPIDYLTLLSKQ